MITEIQKEPQSKVLSQNSDSFSLQKRGTQHPRQMDTWQPLLATGWTTMMSWRLGGKATKHSGIIFFKSCVQKQLASWGLCRTDVEGWQKLPIEGNRHLTVSQDPATSPLPGGEVKATWGCCFQQEKRKGFNFPPPHAICFLNKVNLAATFAKTWLKHSRNFNVAPKKA